MNEPGIDAPACLDHLSAAIRIRTVSHEERERNHPGAFYEFHAFLRDTYPLTTRVCAVEAVNDLSLLITWEGTEPQLDPIMLMAHMDVVPIEDGTEEDWDVEPFSGAVVDGEVWGRGALDDKGPLIAIMEAVEHLLRKGFEPRRTVLLAFGHDEELGGFRGAAEIATILLARRIRPWIVIDEGGWVVDRVKPLTDQPVALVATTEKGYVELELTAFGAGGHASSPPPSTAIGKLAAALARLEANPLPTHVEVLGPQFAALASRLTPQMRLLLANLRLTGPIVARQLLKDPLTAATIRTTTAVTMVAGGVKPNVLPQEARAVVNFRILPGDSIESVTTHVERLVGPDIAVERHGDHWSEPPEPSSTESPAWEVLAHSVEETFPEAVVAPWTMSGATDSRHFRDIASDVYGFNAFTGDREILGRFHGTGERIRAADAARAVSFFVRLIRNAQQTES